MPDCQDVIAELAERHDVFIVTAAMDVPCSFDAKYRWLRRHFPFVPPSHFVFCGDKSIVDADYLIDDRPRHLQRFKGQALLFSAPHNADETRFHRVASWREIRDLFTAIDASPAGVAPRPVRRASSPANRLVRSPASRLLQETQQPPAAVRASVVVLSRGLAPVTMTDARRLQITKA